MQSAPKGQVAYSTVCITSVSTFRGVKDQVQNIPPRKNSLLVLPKPTGKKKREPKSSNSPTFSVYILFLNSFILIFLKRIDYQHWKPTSVTVVKSHVSYFIASIYMQLLYITRFSKPRNPCSLHNGQKSNKQ